MQSTIASIRTGKAYRWINKGLIMQVIKTIYRQPTNTRAAKMQAICQAGSVIISYNHSVNFADNHREACEALRDKLQLTVENECSPMIGGQAQDGHYYWVGGRYAAVTRN